MGYQQSLAYLYGLQRFGIKLGLTNIQTLLARLDHPERAMRIVHVAGTNGKGSVSAATALILQTAGYRTGLYTSPHLHSFTERIRIDGVQVSEPDMVSLVDEVRAVVGSLPVTFFEFTTAMALVYFRNRHTDFAVLEVGMGGRLDATNAVESEISVVTPVCCDHAEHLGADLATIAGEKAGIIKRQVPVVIAEQHPDAQRVLLTKAAEMLAPVCLWDRDFRIIDHDTHFDFFAPSLTLKGLRPGLAGAHQRQNLAVALAACMSLRNRGVALSEEALRYGVEKVQWPGRLEWWRQQRRILLDGAHNHGGAVVLARYLASLDGKKVRWVVGIKGQRCIDDILTPLLPHTAHLYATLPPVDQGIEPDKLVRAARAAGVLAKAYATPADAMTAALADQGEDDVVLVAGSLFLVAAVRDYLMDRERIR
ncbi:folylpolyglutamate synthetase [Syntrophotalea carbinolica DSM 2380]|uniref:Dihydrofolate synthase/folylpolyglutamate synthase n=1 Tax=Syntrophotalea carbinolica (strain DSM 2380 / NBRC 103641 / GraBd1) TaxID=338963 RepID=Q3A6L0_SYNC1|nr:folylpolyglutamate synthase/dihydrofolate synthase family protein [Syntrophotalea carbinolica]ABA87997.1 folylpolyglutamate synthetase [Syntrophotalea carbinolica DSM 2380]